MWYHLGVWCHNGMSIMAIHVAQGTISNLPHGVIDPPQPAKKVCINILWCSLYLSQQNPVCISFDLLVSPHTKHHTTKHYQLYTNKYFFYPISLWEDPRGSMVGSITPCGGQLIVACGAGDYTVVLNSTCNLIPWISNSGVCMCGGRGGYCGEVGEGGPSTWKLFINQYWVWEKSWRKCTHMSKCPCHLCLHTRPWLLIMLPGREW